HGLARRDVLTDNGLQNFEAPSAQFRLLLHRSPPNVITVERTLLLLLIIGKTTILDKVRQAERVFSGEGKAFAQNEKLNSPWTKVHRSLVSKASRSPKGCPSVCPLTTFELIPTQKLRPRLMAPRKPTRP